MSPVETLLGNVLVTGILRILALALVAAVVTGIVTFFYRVRTGQQFPEGPTVLVGLGAVALILNTRLVLVQFIGEGGDPLTQTEAMVNVVVFIAAGVASYGGRRGGERLATSERVTAGRFQPDFSPLVRAVGRYITVTLPEEIEDIEGYDPVDAETKEILAGRELSFSRGLTVTQLQTQLTAKVREEYDVGYVDIELGDDGTVEYLALGQRAAGLGPNLPPNAGAVAIRADPPFSATAGDTVQIWQVTDGAEERIGLAELRAAVGPVATVVTDKQLADRLDPTVEYRLMTLPADAYPDKEFAGILRREDETMSVVELAAGSPLVGTTVGDLEVTVIAHRSAGGTIETLPKRDRQLAAGDSVFAIGRPDALRRLEQANGVTPTEPGVPPEAATPSFEEPDTT